MTQADLGHELLVAAAQPLLPVEKKLTGWSVGIGLTLLIVLVVVNQYFPSPV